MIVVTSRGVGRVVVCVGLVTETGGAPVLRRQVVLSREDAVPVVVLLAGGTEYEQGVCGGAGTEIAFEDFRGREAQLVFEQFKNRFSGYSVCVHPMYYSSYTPVNTNTNEAKYWSRRTNTHLQT